MEITLSENLKDLRYKKGNTQEDLAAYLDISFQAISKWERNETFPDITLLPKIAAYYNTSIDDLLGVGKIREQEKIADYYEKGDDYQKKGDLDGNLAVWTEAFKEFPNNYVAMYYYMIALILKNNSRENPNEYADEIIKIAERLLKESPGHRNGVISKLCDIYTRLGNEEKAVEYAKKATLIENTEAHLLSQIYKGAKLVETVQLNLLREFVYLADDEIYSMMWNGDLNRNGQKKACQRRLKLYEWLFEDGDYGYYNTRVARIYADLAILDAVDEDFNATDKNIDGVIDNLSIMADYEIKFFTDKSNSKRTSFLVNRTQLEGGFQGYSSSSDNACKWGLNFMKRNWFDLCREDKRFKEIEKRFAKYAN
ncbi:MAG: helix-turn-helix domain-containing protein [Oscillospiraceae bacterium]|nr:helix-turn-helix domain-containing protein [Oscillospiraceae bacterium]